MTWVNARGSDPGYAGSIPPVAFTMNIPRKTTSPALLGINYQRAAVGMFSHSNLVTILNREGEIIHQRPGLKGGLIEADAALTMTAKLPR